MLDLDKRKDLSVDLNPDEWRLVLGDPAINYAVDDQQLGLDFTQVGDPTDADMERWVAIHLAVDLEHIETGLRVRKILHLTPMIVYQLEPMISAAADELRKRGIQPGTHWPER